MDGAKSEYWLSSNLNCLTSTMKATQRGLKDTFRDTTSKTEFDREHEVFFFIADELESCQNLSRLDKSTIL